MNLIVVEGLDGAGKSTQINLLKNYFGSAGMECSYMHFPRNDAPFFGELVSRFLRGEFGKLEDVDPYLVAMIYAGDRKDASELLENWLSAGRYVLLDRYVYSNIAYQCAKTKSDSEREKLKNWIFELEFRHFSIPKPAINIFLDVPFKFTSEKLQGKRDGEDRKYLNGNNDIHESSLSFQERVRDVYLETSKNDSLLEILDCGSEKGEMLKPDLIFEKILNLLKTKGII